MGGDAVRACGSVLDRVQVRVNPCGARGGAGRSHTAVWNGRKRESLSIYITILAYNTIMDFNSLWIYGFINFF